MEEEKCLFCGSSLISSQYIALDDVYTCRCPDCIQYSVTQEFKQSNAIRLSQQQRFLVSGYLREMNELSKDVVVIDDGSIEDILNSPYLARTSEERASKFLLYMYRRTRDSGITLHPQKASLSICYATNTAEYDEAVSSLLVTKFIKECSDRYKLTDLGIQQAKKIEEMKVVIPKGGYVFVAMWFSEEMRRVDD